MFSFFCFNFTLMFICLLNQSVIILFYVRLFMALDVNRDEHIDFKELCCGISAACRGPMAERMKCISHQVN